MFCKRNGRWAYHNAGDFKSYERNDSWWVYIVAIAFVSVMLAGSWFAEARNIEPVVQQTEDAKEKPSIVVPQNSVKITARVTGYSTTDSCHNKNTKGGCLNANGKVAKLGDVACPHWLKLGTKIKYQNKIYTCNDRTADWVQQKWVRTPTFDVFHESCAKNACGLSNGTIEILTD